MGLNAKSKDPESLHWKTYWSMLLLRALQDPISPSERLEFLRIQPSAMPTKSLSELIGSIQKRVEDGHQMGLNELKSCIQASAVTVWMIELSSRMPRVHLLIIREALNPRGHRASQSTWDERLIESQLSFYENNQSITA